MMKTKNPKNTKKINPNSFVTFKGKFYRNNGHVAEVEENIPYFAILNIEKIKDIGRDFGYWVKLAKSPNRDGYGYSGEKEKEWLEFRVDKNTYEYLQRKIKQVDFNIPLTKETEATLKGIVKPQRLNSAILQLELTEE